MRLAIVLPLTAALLAGAAFACPGRDAPCEVDGGFYHAGLPLEGAARGLVLYLHGWGGVGRAALSDGHWTAPMRARGYALVAPQGEPRRPGDRGGAWNSRAAAGARDDVAFLRRVIADARRRFGLDGTPTLVSGFSGGGMMVWRLACDAPDSADAYAPVAGLLWRPLPERCAGPVRLLHIHGWDDPVVPVEGRSVAGGRLTQGDLFSGLALLRRANGCETDAPAEARVRDGLWLRRWDCAAALGLGLFPGGHVAPEGWGDLALDWLEETPG